jgi:YHS domain-containing protein
MKVWCHRFSEFQVRWLAICAVAFVTTSAYAEGEVNSGYFGNVAVKGYDVVAYFSEGRAVRGNARFAQDWLGHEWYFASAENRETFVTNPVTYMPQYGGYCAVGVSVGERSHDIDPEAFKIIDGKLYLNYSKSVAELLTPAVIAAADADWAARPTDAADATD